MDRLNQLLGFLEKAPKDAFLNFAIAKEYEGSKNDEKALEFYLKMKTNTPDYVGFYYHLGKLYVRQNQIEKALLTYKEGMAVAKKVNDKHAFSELASANLEIDDGY